MTWMVNQTMWCDNQTGQKERKTHKHNTVAHLLRSAFSSKQCEALFEQVKDRLPDVTPVLGFRATF